MTMTNVSGRVEAMTQLSLYISLKYSNLAKSDVVLFRIPKLSSSIPSTKNKHFSEFDSRYDVKPGLDILETFSKKPIVYDFF